MESATPISEAQEAYFKNYESGKSQVLRGSAGTGKTYLALASAFDEILGSKSRYRRVVIVRSAVATRDIGHLPGSLEEKQAIY
jgi:predicted ribonuclease YlaK